MSLRRSTYAVIVEVAAIACFSHLRVVIATDVLTQHNNNTRTGATLDETILNTSTIRAATFGKKWTLFADGQVVAQPLHVSRLADGSSSPTCNSERLRRMGESFAIGTSRKTTGSAARSGSSTGAAMFCVSKGNVAVSRP